MQPEPLPLDPGLVDRLWRAADVLSTELTAIEPDDSPEDDTALWPGLGRGGAGLALAHHYLAPLFPQRLHRARCDSWLSYSFAGASRADHPFLYGGITGIAWAAQHLGRVAGAGAGDDPLAWVDELLANTLEQEDEWPDFDLIHGLAGLALYSLERPRSAAADRIRAALVHRMEERSTVVPGGRSWLVHHARLGRAPCFDLGVAHGQAGVVVALAVLAVQGVEFATCRRLLDEAVSWLLRQRRHGATALFPAFASQAGETLGSTCRNAWCYGDAGIGATLWVAARLADEPAWECEALDIARSAAKRHTAECLVEDAPFCHGATGLAHVFHRLFRQTGDPIFALAAERWLSKGLELRRPDGKLGGFSYRVGDAETQFEEHPGVLTGAAGVALCFASVLDPREPAWDAMFGLSVPQLVDATP